MLFLFSSCDLFKNPVGPDTPDLPQYVEVGEVTYIRELGVRCPNCIEDITLVILNQGEIPTNVWGHKMQKNGDKWEVYIFNQILVNYPKHYGKEHEIYVIDNKLAIAGLKYSSRTGYGIYINGTRISKIEKYEDGTIGKFRIDKHGNLHFD
ncbi:MAG: hypothetical protein ACTSSP_06175 [Candidatus Asgardarchaeia archaeon]